MPIASAFRLLARRPDVPLNPTDPRLLRSMVQPNNTLLDCISSALCTFKSEPFPLRSCLGASPPLDDSDCSSAPKRAPSSLFAQTPLPGSGKTRAYRLHREKCALVDSHAPSWQNALPYSIRTARATAHLLNSMQRACQDPYFSLCLAMKIKRCLDYPCPSAITL